MRSFGKIPVILLDCEQRSQEGVMQTFGRRGVPIVAVSSVSNCPAFHSRYVSKRYVLPHMSNGVESYIERLENLPYRGVILYSNDVSALILSRYRERLIAAGFLINIPEIPVVLKVFDKWSSYQLARTLNIPVAKSQLVETIDDIQRYWDDFQKPVILKGTRLVGGRYQKIDSENAVRQGYQRMMEEITSERNRLRDSRIILQEWLEFEIDDQWCCETVYDQNSNPMGFFTIKKIRSSLTNEGAFTSRLYAGEYMESLEVSDMTRTILSSVKWKGFAHVEFFYVPKQKKIFFTEVNPRLPGFSYYPSQAGYDMAYYYYADLTGTPFVIPHSFPKSVYFETFRFPGDLSDGIKNILKGHIGILPYIKSYLRLFERGTIKVIDPIKSDDLSFTLFIILDTLKYLFFLILRPLHRKIFQKRR